MKFFNISKISANIKKRLNTSLVHSHVFNCFIFTLLCENGKRSLIFSDAVAEVTELWEVELLDSLILINVVPGISVVVRSSDNF